jgi:glycosyltransferase involved in cell wall biosynthesis
MRIGLNLLPAVPGIGGGWTYYANVLRARACHGDEHEYVVFMTKASRPIVPDVPNFRTVELPFRAEWRPLRVGVESTVFPVLARQERLDCIHHFAGGLPFLSTRPSVVTIHDLIVLERPNEFPMLKASYVRLMQRRAARFADILAPVSRSTATRLKTVFGVGDDRLEIVPAGVASHFGRAPASAAESFRRKYRLPAAFWLYVAEPYPHKNHALLLNAMVALRHRSASTWPLVLRGTLTPALRWLIESSGAAADVVVLPHLNDDEMPLLYTAASALVFPSLHEGGGLPVIEAMACGCPVVASDIPTTREFAGPAALTFDPKDLESLVVTMLRCQESSDVRRKLVRTGTVAAAKLRPEVVAQACLTAYERATRTITGPIAGVGHTNGRQHAARVATLRR